MNQFLVCAFCYVLTLYWYVNFSEKKKGFPKISQTLWYGGWKRTGRKTWVWSLDDVFRRLKCKLNVNYYLNGKFHKKIREFQKAVTPSELSCYNNKFSAKNSYFLQLQIWYWLIGAFRLFPLTVLEFFHAYQIDKWRKSKRQSYFWIYNSDLS
jgi:hypothetical protein